jgi:deoxyadenosine/deoxycytidine kinase
MDTDRQIPFLHELLSRKTPVEIAVIGTIGSGKSTLVKILKEWGEKSVPGTLGLPEGTERLIETGLLADYIEDINKKITDQKNLAYIFQHGIMIERKKMRKNVIQNFPESKLVFSEGTVYADRYIFADILHQQHSITGKIWDIYQEWFDDTLKEIPFLPSAYILIDLPTDLCIKRMSERDRKGEDGYPRVYLESLNEKYRELFGGKEFLGKPCFRFPSEFIVDGKQVSYPDYRENQDIQRLIADFSLQIVRKIVS